MSHQAAVAFTPEGIFVGYPQPKGDGFDPEQARKLLGEAGYPVTNKPGGGYECKTFPVDEVEFVFNTVSSNKTMAEFMQAQWKQKLGITVRLRSMEFKTYMNVSSKLEYKGFAIGIWGADYMDPYTFLDSSRPRAETMEVVGGIRSTSLCSMKRITRRQRKAL